MKKYIEKIEKLVVKKMNAKSEKKEEKKEQKGFMARKNETQIKEEDNTPTDLMDIVADAIVQIRKKRMGIKDGTTI